MFYSFIKKIINKFYYKKIVIRNKFVHFLPNDKFSEPFISFMNKYFNDYDQCFVYLLPDMKKNFDIPKNLKDVFVIRNLKELVLDFNLIEKIYFHSLGNKKIIFYLYKNKKLLKLSYWIIWGYDLYNKLKISYLKDKFCGYTKKDKYVKSNVKAIITTFDKERYIKKYNKDKKIIELPFYPSVISESLLNSVNVQKTCYKVIQINNSADKSTLEILDVLEKFKDENIKIVTILSYGHTEYNSKILQKGKSIFGDKFAAILDYMSKQDYAKHLKNIDILILNQRRQQGVGNVRCNLYLKNKVYIRKEVSTYKGLISKGFKIFDTNEIENMSFEDFIKINDLDKNLNRKLVLDFFGDKAIIKSWKTFYND